MDCIMMVITRRNYQMFSCIMSLHSHIAEITPRTLTDKFSVWTNPGLTEQIELIPRLTECIYLDSSFCLHLKGLFVHWDESRPCRYIMRWARADRIENTQIYCKWLFSTWDTFSVKCSVCRVCRLVAECPSRLESWKFDSGLYPGPGPGPDNGMIPGRHRHWSDPAK